MNIKVTSTVVALLLSAAILGVGYSADFDVDAVAVSESGYETVDPLYDDYYEEEEEIVLIDDEPFMQEETSTDGSYLGYFTLTAYCPCQICCGEYALNRPVDEDGNEIIYGASGNRLIPNKSVAVDPTVIPYGTAVLINGREYVASDCGGAVKGNKIDMFFATHEEACSFGLQFADVYLAEGQR